MTEAEQFATEFLGVQPESFPIHINLKITGELLDAYVAHIEKKKADSIMNTYSETVSPFIRSKKQPFSLTNDTKDEHKPRCCGKCDGVNDLCVSDMGCMEHSVIGCEICYGPREQKSNIPNVRILVWDWKNNCYEPENSK